MALRSRGASLLDAPHPTLPSPRGVPACGNHALEGESNYRSARRPAAKAAARRSLAQIQLLGTRWTNPAVADCREAYGKYCQWAWRSVPQLRWGQARSGSPRVVTTAWTFTIGPPTPGGAAHPNTPITCGAAGPPAPTNSPVRKSSRDPKPAPPATWPTPEPALPRTPKVAILPRPALVPTQPADSYRPPPDTPGINWNLWNPALCRRRPIPNLREHSLRRARLLSLRPNVIFFR
jgi:hypothetical protein